MNTNTYFNINSEASQMSSNRSKKDHRLKPSGHPQKRQQMRIHMANQGGRQRVMFLTLHRRQICPQLHHQILPQRLLSALNGAVSLRLNTISAEY